MSGSDNLLDKLFGSGGRRGKSNDDPHATGEKGLNPLDLLGLPAAQRDLINWLSRQKQARFDEIQQALGTDAMHLAAVLADLKKAGHIHEALIAGEIFYRVVFGGKISRAARGLPDNIWARVDLDNSAFLREIPLFHDLPDDELKDIANNLDERRYRRNEVILWQGDLGTGVYFIKSGIVGLGRLLSDKRSTQTLTYLKQGDLLGEFGLLSEQHTAAHTTATALSDVDVLLMQREHLLELFQRHPSAAVELVQMLTRRLVASDAQIARYGEKTTRLCLVFGVGAQSGCTTVGSALATTLAHVTQQPVVYTEHPTSDRLTALFGFDPDTEVYTHSGGYDVLVPQDVSVLPSAVRTTLVIDRMMDHYASVVVGIPGRIDDTVVYMLERADQVVLIVPPDERAWNQLSALKARLKVAIRPEKTGLFVIANRTGLQHDAATLPGPVDFDVPRLENLPPLAERTFGNLPHPLAEMAEMLVNRLGRTNQIGIYIPTDLDFTAGNIQTYVDQTRAFLTGLFGSAVDTPMPGEGDGERSGQSGENMIVVETYITKTDMDHHLGNVLEFVEKLKIELHQDVMALEVNQKVLLI